MAAQPVVSATLGRDDARYQVRPKAGAQSRRADVPRASCPCSGMAKMAMAQSVGALSAQNPAQRLQADFTRQGMEVRSGQTHWRLELSGYGYGERRKKVEGTAPWSKGNRVEYQHGSLVEWYVNGPAGVEQGFTLSAPPALGTRDTGYGIRDTGQGITDNGTPGSSPLTIALKIGGDLMATADSWAVGKDARAEGLTLRDGHGQAVLRYTGLTAHDASGRTLVAWLEVDREEMRLRVEDAGARYPVVVDPFVQQAELTASDGVANDYLGYSVGVSSDGRTIVASAPQYWSGGPGAAYVFVKPEGGWANMTQVAKLTPSDGAEYNELGYSVAVSSDGGTIVAGAPNATIGSNSQQGAAYVFVKPRGGWANMTQTAKLTASDGVSEDQLGYSVGVSREGSTIVAGAIYADGQGAAYVFVMPGGGWATTSTFTAKLTASGGVTEDEFGYSVSVSSDGSTIVAGAIFAPFFGPGAAYVFVKPSTGWATTSTFTAKLIASVGEPNDVLGVSVGVNRDGSTIVASAPNTHIGFSNSYEGAAYVFVMPEGGWVNATYPEVQSAELTASDGARNDHFGNSVGISGDGRTIVAGDPGKGAAYAFVKRQSGWPQTAKLTTSDGSYLGSSLGVTGNGSTIVAGAPYATIGANDWQGAAYVFVSLLAPTVTFTGPPKSAPYQGTFTVASTTNSSSSPVYTSSGACTNSGTLYTMTSGIGVCTSTVTWAADTYYDGATRSQKTTALKIGQTISFTKAAPAKASYHSTFPVAADSTSNLTVALSVDAGSAGVCSLGVSKTVSGVTSATVTMLKGAGNCTIDAKQTGNGDYSAAAPQQTSAAAQKIGQTIKFTQKAPSSASYKSTFPVAADSTSGLRVALSVDVRSLGNCSLGGRKTVSGVTSATVTMLSSSGTCTLDANQAGNGNYNAAPQKQTSAKATP